MSVMQGGDAFEAIAVKVNMIMFLHNIGLDNEHKKVLDL